MRAPSLYSYERGAIVGASPACFAVLVLDSPDLLVPVPTEDDQKILAQRLYTSPTMWRRGFSYPIPIPLCLPDLRTRSLRTESRDESLLA